MERGKYPLNYFHPLHNFFYYYKLLLLLLVIILLLEYFSNLRKVRKNVILVISLNLSLANNYYFKFKYFLDRNQVKFPNFLQESMSVAVAGINLRAEAVKGESRRG